MKALVTGASGGIGLEIAKLLAADKYDLYLVARNGEKLKEICDGFHTEYGISAEPIAMDLSDYENVDSIKDITGDVDILVNNAGFGDFGMFHSSDWEKQESMIKLNDMTLAKMMHLYLPEMVNRGSGKILNIASIASFQAGPMMSAYHASKAFVLSLSESVATELKGTGVTVTAICPGPVRTKFFDVANMSKVYSLPVFAEPEDVAYYGYRSMLKGRVVVVNGWLFKTAVFLERILPRSVVRRVVLGIQNRVRDL